MMEYSNDSKKDSNFAWILLIWSLYYPNQQKRRHHIVGFCKKLQIQWKRSLQCPNQHKYVDFLFIWSWFSSSVLYRTSSSNPPSSVSLHLFKLNQLLASFKRRDLSFVTVAHLSRLTPSLSKTEPRQGLCFKPPLS